MEVGGGVCAWDMRWQEEDWQMKALEEFSGTGSMIKSHSAVCSVLACYAGPPSSAI